MEIEIEIDIEIDIEIGNWERVRKIEREKFL